MAEEVGINICAHPDNPSWALLGLPRVLSTEEDYAHMLDAVESRASGVTFCTGSLGARGANDLPAMAKRFAPRIHFAHLRNVHREEESVPCSFYERSEEHTSELQSLMRISYAVFCLKKKINAAKEALKTIQ